MDYVLITPFIDQFKVERRILTLKDHLTFGDVLYVREQVKNQNDLTGFHMVARVAGLDFKDLAAMDMRDIDQIDEHIGRIRAPLPKPEESSE